VTVTAMSARSVSRTLCPSSVGEYHCSARRKPLRNSTRGSKFHPPPHPSTPSVRAAADIAATPFSTARAHAPRVSSMAITL
jgi:hypothetical protein